MEPLEEVALADIVITNEIEGVSQVAEDTVNKLLVKFCLENDDVKVRELLSREDIYEVLDLDYHSELPDDEMYNIQVKVFRFIFYIFSIFLLL